MAEESAENMILVVTGASLRAEAMDRPLAYQVKAAIDENLREAEPWQCTVISDIWYLNNDVFSGQPTISVGGPGVNALSSFFYERLPTLLAVENVLLIQMDLGGDARRCAVWGMDHEMTVEAVDTFLQKGYLQQFLRGLITI